MEGEGNFRRKVLSFLVQKNWKVAAKLWHSAKHRKLLSSGRPVVGVQALFGDLMSLDCGARK